jgi:hypothetical protein
MSSRFWANAIQVDRAWVKLAREDACPKAEDYTPAEGIPSEFVEPIRMKG